MRKIIAVIGSEALGDIIIDELKTEFDVTLCRSARECLPLLQKPFDGMILDLFLPGNDGIMLLRRISHNRPSVIIVLTIFLSEQLLYQLSELGVNYVMRLPYSVRDIKARLSASLDPVDTF